MVPKVCIIRTGTLSEFGYRHRPLDSEKLTLELDAFDLVQSFSREITFATVGAAHHGNILDYQQVRPSTIAARNKLDPYALLSTNVTDFALQIIVVHGYSLFSIDRNDDSIASDTHLGTDSYAVTIN